MNVWHRCNMNYDQNHADDLIYTGSNHLGGPGDRAWLNY